MPLNVFDTVVLILGLKVGNPLKNEIHRCQPSRIRRDSPAFSSDVPRPAKSDRCPAFFEIVLLFFRCRLFYMFLCLTTQHSDELRIKIGSKFARRQATDYKYTITRPRCAVSRHSTAGKRRFCRVTTRQDDCLFF